MITLQLLTAQEMNIALAHRLVAIRKRKGFSQKELARRSGVTYASLRRFESTGEISLSSLSKLAIALGVDEEINSLFTNVPFQSIEEVLRGAYE